jgi:hypothetical protein
MTIISDIDRAKETLKAGGFSFVVAKAGEILYSGRSSGIKELVEAISESHGSFRGAALADKIIGRAAALLILHAGIQHVHAGLISEEGKRALRGMVEHLSYDLMVPIILNRTGDDRCPMEKRSLAMTSPGEAFDLFSAFFAGKK